MSPETREKVEELLIQADLRVRSLPTADQSHVEHIRAALALLREDDGWCYDMEKAPKDGERILLTFWLHNKPNTVPCPVVASWIEGEGWMIDYELSWYPYQPFAWRRIDLPTAKESEG